MLQRLTKLEEELLKEKELRRGFESRVAANKEIMEELRKEKKLRRELEERLKLLETDFCKFILGLQPVERVLVGARIEFEQHIAPGDGLVALDVNFNHPTRNPRHHLCCCAIDNQMVGLGLIEGHNIPEQENADTTDNGDDDLVAIGRFDHLEDIEDEM